jgi:hypothetical protein
VPPPWQGLIWGILPIGVSLLAIFLELLLPKEHRISVPVETPVRAEDPERHYVA